MKHKLLNSRWQHYDIEIYDSDDNQIWNWANDKAFLNSETELALFNPNEIKTFEKRNMGSNF